MVERRFGPLMVGAVLAFLLLSTRLFQVQVVEYDVWAREATNLVREGTIEPHRRGRIRDRKGETIARDELIYELEFVWRQFRRGHPLGQVAQMRSLLEMRPVSLEEAFDHLYEWADELVDLSPAEIDAFGRGGETVLTSLVIEASADPGADRRWARAGDLHYYVKALLDLDRRAARRIARKRKDPELWRRPYIELAASDRDDSASSLREELYRRLEESLAHLDRLATLLPSEGAGGARGMPGVGGLEELVERIEATRRYVEDSTADDLFQKAAGFGAWRLDARNLARIDLEWLRRCLYWDAARLNQWVLDRGTLWPRVVDSYLAGHTVARFKVGAEDPGDRVLNALLHFFQPPERRAGVHAAIPRDWRSTDDLIVLSALADHFEGVAAAPAPGGDDPVLPLQARELVNAQPPSPTDLVEEVLARTWHGTVERTAESTRATASALIDLAGRGRMTWHGHEIEDVGSILKGWNRRLQSRVAAELDEVEATVGGVRLVEEWIKSASEERAYVVRDRSARPTRLAAEPGYDLVQLVTRFPKRYAGFVVRNRTRRAVESFDIRGAEVPIARELIGRVRAPYLARLLEQRQYELELYDLQTKLRRADEDEQRILELVETVVTPDEFQGGSGIEAYFDRELRGRNGYRETQGLQDRRSGKRDPIRDPAVDGDDLILTLDLELQRAAQETLLYPDPLPASEDKPDPVWLAHAVGAIVLITPEGDVLAAASVPVEPGTRGPYQDGEVESAIERTLRRPRGEPPGSVFKPFVAAWALQYRALDPDQGLVFCLSEHGQEARYGKVRCHSRIGHSFTTGQPLDLATALRRSCNAYFALVGEQYFAGADFRDMASTYGFGQPVGVRSLGNLRRGWIEDYRFDGPLAMAGVELRDVEKQRLGNGLSHIDVTPMQVARAYAGLATGSLPDLRLVRFAGSEELRSRSRALPVEPRHLGRVQAALREVVTHSQGTAHGKGLDRGSLGFSLAVKTGSADYKPGKVPDYPLSGDGPIRWVDGMRKHTWVAGWFPAEEPRAIVVIYVHDTSTTSSHGAVYLAAQFLSSPAIHNYLIEQGVALDFGGGR